MPEPNGATLRNGSSVRPDGRSPLLQIDDLTVGYVEKSRSEPVRIVRSVDLTIERHEVLGLVGESGSGKTQTARAILKVNTRPLEPLSGHIYLDGVDLLTLEGDQLREVRGGKVSMIFQDPRASLNPLMRIGDQLARIYALHNGISQQAARKDALDMLRRVGIAGPERVARSFPHQLSGGMCQRVMIGLSVGINPALLIADEPTTGLDVTIQAQILELIGEMQAETGASVLLITHDLGVVAEICQRVAVMYAGRVVEIAPASSIFDHPRHPYTVRLLKASLALESPEKESVADAAEVVEIATSAALTVGDNVYRASLESAEDPDSGAEMIEVAPNHVVLCTREQREAGAPSEIRSGEAGAIS